MARILVLESQPSAKLALRRFLESEGHACDVRSGWSDGAGAEFDLALVDADLVSSTQAASSLGAPRVIVLLPRGLPPWPAASPVLGSLNKPLDFRELADLMGRALADSGPSETAVMPEHEATGILTRDPAMLRLLNDVGRLAPLDVTVLITGESGTGKELVARALHERSPRSSEPFEAIHCGAIVADLLESELFGHEKGSFTDAHAAKPGRFEVAGAGTIFLDEIGEMPLALQVKLLRALQEREIHRIGGIAPIAVRARVVAATHRDLRELAAAGAFREDLLHRLHVATLHLPPLRDRPGDVELLAAAFLRACAARHDRPVRGLSAPAIAMLRRRSWPGNVRELMNAVERAVILASEPVLGPDDFEEAPALPRAEAAASFRRALDREIRSRRRAGETDDAIRSGLQQQVDGALGQESDPGPSAAAGAPRNPRV